MDDETAVALLRAIREHSGLELASIRDAGTHGADSGFGGFTYYSDTVEFYDGNEELIWKALADDAENLGAENVIAMIGGFGGAQHVYDLTTFKNLLAWYALEAAGHWLLRRQEDR